MPKVKVEMVVNDEIVQKIVDILYESAFTEIFEMESFHNPG